LKHKSGAGFTIMELVIVIGIFAVVLAFGLPIGLDSYRNYLLTSEQRNLVSILRRAENLSLANNGGLPHGVALGEGQYVLYQGSSYAVRNQAFDENYPRVSSVAVSSTPEINFLNLSAMPSVTGTIVLSNGLRSLTITVNDQGAILW